MFLIFVEGHIFSQIIVDLRDEYKSNERNALDKHITI